VNNSSHDDCSCSRRSFIGGLVAAGAALALPKYVLAAQKVPEYFTKRALWLQRWDSGEQVVAPFTLDGRKLYLPGYYKLCELLRDHHVEWARGAKYINVQLIEALWEVQLYFWRDGRRVPIVVHSGYRSPETNAATEGAARNSLHVWGEAVDFHVPGVSIDELWQVCWKCSLSGGVGYYPGGWVHLDVGEKRYWSG
jgi:uncharacterized protein YcbK (DUF882 family)